MAETYEIRECLRRIEEQLVDRLVALRQLLEQLVVLQGGVIQEPQQLPAEIHPGDGQQDPTGDDAGQDAENR